MHALGSKAPEFCYRYKMTHCMGSSEAVLSKSVTIIVESVCDPVGSSTFCAEKAPSLLNKIQMIVA